MGCSPAHLSIAPRRTNVVHEPALARQRASYTRHAAKVAAPCAGKALYSNRKTEQHLFIYHLAPTTIYAARHGPAGIRARRHHVAASRRPACPHRGCGWHCWVCPCVPPDGPSAPPGWARRVVMPCRGAAIGPCLAWWPEMRLAALPFYGIWTQPLPCLPPICRLTLYRAGAAPRTDVHWPTRH